jgi:hypothetical protein
MTHTMADIIPFPTDRTRPPAPEPSGGVPLHQAEARYAGGLAPGKAGKLEKIMEEIEALYEHSSIKDCAYCKINVGDDEEDIDSAKKDLSSLTELIVFSPEIQRDEFETEEPDESRSREVRWGDVFFKSGDVYPFLFTVYTEDYVKHQFVSYGEQIKPSPKDIILRNKQLSPPDIIRAVLKWVNLYSPEQRGIVVRLESGEVLKNLVCEPGIEVVVAESS